MLYCINQLNEAVHISGIDVIVMVRPTGRRRVSSTARSCLSSGSNKTPFVFDLCNNFGTLGGITGMQERLERAYSEMTKYSEEPIHEPKDFNVIDEIKDPR